MIKEDEEKKVYITEHYKYIFSKEDGTFARWGTTQEDDPEMAPGPEILDLEISTGKCKKNCDYCLYKDTSIQLSNNESKKIQDIKIGDKVLSYNVSKQKIVENEVLEVYKRPYNNILINIELENGQVLKITPEHKVFVKEKGFIEAGSLVEGDDILNIV